MQKKYSSAKNSFTRPVARTYINIDRHGCRDRCNRTAPQIPKWITKATQSDSLGIWRTPSLSDNVLYPRFDDRQRYHNGSRDVYRTLVGRPILRPAIHKVGPKLRPFVSFTHPQSTNVEASLRTLDDMVLAEEGRTWSETEQLPRNTLRFFGPTNLRDNLREKCIHGENLSAQSQVIVDDRHFTEIPLIGLGDATPPAMLYLESTDDDDDGDFSIPIGSTIQSPRVSVDLRPLHSDYESSLLHQPASVTETDQTTESEPTQTNSATLETSWYSQPRSTTSQPTTQLGSEETWYPSLTEYPGIHTKTHQKDGTRHIDLVHPEDVESIPEFSKEARGWLARTLWEYGHSDASVPSIPEADMSVGLLVYQSPCSDVSDEIGVKIPGSYVSGDGESIGG